MHSFLDLHGNKIFVFNSILLLSSPLQHPEEINFEFKLTLQFEFMTDLEKYLKDIEIKTTWEKHTLFTRLNSSLVKQLDNLLKYSLNFEVFSDI